jgi:hypothetical protein
MKKVGIKYCGGCNPEIDIETFVVKLKSYLSYLGYTITTDNDTSCSLIIVNGCKVGCLKRERFKSFQNIVVINGASIDLVDVEESILAQKTVEKLFGGNC